MTTGKPNNGSEPQDRLKRLLTYRFSRINARLNAQAVRVLHDATDLSLTEWRVLVMLDAFGSTNAAEMARRSALDKGQLSRCVKGLLERGLLASSSSPRDSRTQILEMTPEGRRVFDTARPSMRARQDVLTAALAPEALEQLHDALDRLEAVIEGLETPE